MMHKRQPAPIRALREGAIVDERPRPSFRPYALAFLLGLVVGATVACGYFWWRLDALTDRTRPVLYDGGR